MAYMCTDSGNLMAIAQQVIKQKQQQEQQEQQQHQHLLGSTITTPLSLHHPWNTTPPPPLGGFPLPAPADFPDPFQVGSGPADPGFQFPPLDPHSAAFRFSDFDSDDWMDTLMANADSTETPDFSNPFTSTCPPSDLNRVIFSSEPQTTTTTTTVPLQLPTPPPPSKPTPHRNDTNTTTETTPSSHPLLKALTDCAILAETEPDRAIESLTHLSKTASQHGNPTQRVAFYFTQALTHKITAEKEKTEKPKEKQKNFSMVTTWEELTLSSYKALNDACPYSKFAHLTANQAILEATEGSTEIHIVDFGIVQGIQWAALLQAFATRSSGKPQSIRISGIPAMALGTSPGSSLTATGNRLSEFAGFLTAPPKQEKKSNYKIIATTKTAPFLFPATMPSLPLSNGAVSIESPKDDKSNKKKKKDMKKEKNNHHDHQENDAVSIKKSKKRKKEEEDEEKSDTSSELVEPTEEGSRMKSSEKKKKKKARAVEEEEEEDVERKKEEDPNAVSNFRISEPLKAKLKEKGIEALFPIQAMTFNTILDGSDLVGRARTGQGKTLAFVLPILESLTNGPAKAARRIGYGRSPSVLVLLPTRELANQVYADFEVYGSAMGLASCCVYGGAPYNAQEIKLRRGVDIVIGTPGRIKDHIERGNIDLSQLRFRVLDEADEMLRMGFVEDVELILGKVDDVNKVQTLLFSATLPSWVKQISAKFLKADKKTADLVGNEKMKASINVRHIVLPCNSSARSQLIPDIIRCYSSGGRTIIFTEKKESASELAGLLPGARALHGDIQQSQREVTLSGFRSGKFTTLVATNVAARGLDINDVQLIIQCEPPRDIEAYIHRSGRTGRAGNTGVAVMLYDSRRSNISKIEREVGVKFEHVSAPQPDDIAKAVGGEAAEMITNVSDSVIPAFKSAAEELLNNSGLSAVELLAKALAKAVGFTDIKKRSLLTSMENYVTLLLENGRPIFTPSFAFGILRRFLPEEKVDAVQGLSLTADGNGAVFDVPAKDLDAFLTGQQNAANVSLEVVKELPRLQEREQSRGGRFGGGGRGFSGGGNRFSGGRGGGNRFSGGRGGRGNGGRGGRRW